MFIVPKFELGEVSDFKGESIAIWDKKVQTDRKLKKTGKKTC